MAMRGGVDVDFLGDPMASGQLASRAEVAGGGCYDTLPCSWLQMSLRRELGDDFMCEHCKSSKISGEELSFQEESVPCEYVPDTKEEEDQECPKEARYIVSEYYCETHLCNEHMRKASSQLDEGLGDFLRSVGFQQATDFVPVKERAECEHMGNPMLDEETEFCGRPAAYGQMVLERSVYCDEHARMMGYSPEGEAP